MRDLVDAAWERASPRRHPSDSLASVLKDAALVLKGAELELRELHSDDGKPEQDDTPLCKGSGHFKEKRADVEDYLTYSPPICPELRVPSLNPGAAASKPPTPSERSLFTPPTPNLYSWHGQRQSPVITKVIPPKGFADVARAMDSQETLEEAPAEEAVAMRQETLEEAPAEEAVGLLRKSTDSSETKDPRGVDSTQLLPVVPCLDSIPLQEMIDAKFAELEARPSSTPTTAAHCSTATPIATTPRQSAFIEAWSPRIGGGVREAPPRQALSPTGVPPLPTHSLQRPTASSPLRGNPIVRPPSSHTSLGTAARNGAAMRQTPLSPGPPVAFIQPSPISSCNSVPRTVVRSQTPLAPRHPSPPPCSGTVSVVPSSACAPTPMSPRSPRHFPVQQTQPRPWGTCTPRPASPQRTIRRQLSPGPVVTTTVVGLDAVQCSVAAAARLRVAGGAGVGSVHVLEAARTVGPERQTSPQYQIRHPSPTAAAARGAVRVVSAGGCSMAMAAAAATGQVSVQMSDGAVVAEMTGTSPQRIRVGAGGYPHTRAPLQSYNPPHLVAPRQRNAGVPGAVGPTALAQPRAIGTPAPAPANRWR